jgi:hypothetical protein
MRKGSAGFHFASRHVEHKTLRSIERYRPWQERETATLLAPGGEKAADARTLGESRPWRQNSPWICAGGAFSRKS